MRNTDDNILLEAPLVEQTDSTNSEITEQPEEESLFDILGLEKRHNSEIDDWKYLARLGDDMAFYGLGTCYLEGRGVERDFTEAGYWLEKSCDASSKMHLAFAHEKDGNEKLAEEYYRQAVESQEDRRNVRGLCCYSLAGLLLDRDLDMAAAYFEKMLNYRITNNLREEIPSFAYVLGASYLAVGQPEKAIEWLRFCLRYDRNDTEARETLQAALAQTVAPLIGKEPPMSDLTESLHQPARLSEDIRASAEVEPINEKVDASQNRVQSNPCKKGLFSALFGRKK